MSTIKELAGIIGRLTYSEMMVLADRIYGVTVEEEFRPKSAAEMAACISDIADDLALPD